MLNRAKAAQLITAAEGRIFRQVRSLGWLTKSVWQTLALQESFLEAIALARKTNKDMVTWQGSLADVVNPPPAIKNYQVVAIDGSQIYPDNHMQGVDCFLVHTGFCELSYAEQSSVQFAAEPYIFTSAEVMTIYRQPFFSIDMVDLIREDYELKLLADYSAQGLEGAPRLGLFDGNVFFWHLEAKTQQLKNVFFKRYCAQLERMREQQFVYAGYLSGTRFNDLVKLLQHGLCEADNACGFSGRQLYDLCSMIETLTDADLLAYVLEPGQRTTVFACVGSLVEEYPEQSKPYFFYLHTGAEVVRIELPAWLAVQKKAIDFIVACCLDQTAKGFGYPVALAEAHAQAVVTGADRTFFYDWIHAHSLQQKRQIALSPKSMKKKLLAV